MGKSHFKNTSSRIEQYLSGIDRAQTAKEIAEGLGMTPSGAYTTLQLMEVFGTVQKAKRGSYYYFLKGVYDDEQISAMLPPAHVPIARARARVVPKPLDELGEAVYLEEHLDEDGL